MTHSSTSKAALLALAGAGLVVFAMLDAGRTVQSDAAAAQALPAPAGASARGIRIILVNPQEDSATVFRILNDLADAAPRRASTTDKPNIG